MSEKDSKKDNEKPDEKFQESVGEIISNVVESVSEIVSEVLGTIGQSVEAILHPEESSKENAEKGETTENEKNEEIKAKEIKDETKGETNNETVKAETRIGYQSFLPQSEEPETETAETVTEPDAKNEIETAIAKARETNAEAIEKDELVAEFLPELPSQNIAKLYLQSPNRIFLYWSVAGNPYETLQKAFGNRAGNYQLVTKLVNLQTNAESLAPADFNGNWWYNVRSNTAYRIDLGFYAQNRPFIRLLSSNVVRTPRSAPSSRTDTAADWIVSTKQFAQVLTVSGYSHDVLGIVFGGDEATEIGALSAENSTLAVANHFASVAPDEINLAELRWLLISLAAGAPFTALQNRLSKATLHWIEQVLAANPEALEPENVRSVLAAIFGSEFVEMFTDQNTFGWQRLAPVAVGASAIHFPEILFPQLRFPALRRANAENPFGASFGDDEYLKNLFPTSAEFINE